MDNVGTLKKYSLQITCGGFDMDANPWTVKVWNIGQPGNVKEFGHSNDTGTVGNTVQRDGTWYINVDTDDLGAGVYMAQVDIDVPDTDNQDGDSRHITRIYRLDAIGGAL